MCLLTQFLPRHRSKRTVATQGVPSQSCSLTQSFFVSYKHWKQNQAAFLFHLVCPLPSHRADRLRRSTSTSKFVVCRCSAASVEVRQGRPVQQLRSHFLASQAGPELRLVGAKTLRSQRVPAQRGKGFALTGGAFSCLLTTLSTSTVVPLSFRLSRRRRPLSLLTTPLALLYRARASAQTNQQTTRSITQTRLARCEACRASLLLESTV